MGSAAGRQAAVAWCCSPLLIAGCTAHTGAAPAVTIGRDYPSSYTVLYRQVTNGVAAWEVLRASRPVNGSDLLYPDGPPPNPQATATSGSLSTASGLYAVRAGQVLTVSGREPGPVTADVQLAAELPELLQRRLARALNQHDVVAGRTCQWIRMHEPPSGAITPLSASPEADDHDDLCLDQAGLILHERWTYHAHVVLERTATQVTVNRDDPRLPSPPLVNAANPPPPGAPRITAAAPVDTFLRNVPTPSGYAPLLAPQRLVVPDPARPTSARAVTVTWTFARGAHLITVEAGAEAGQGLPWTAAVSPTATVQLPGLGTAQLALRSDGPEIRCIAAQQGWIRIRGTVTPAILISYARQIPAPSG